MPWDFRVNRNPEGITFEWENEPGANYSLHLYEGDTEIYYGGHYPESADVNFAEFGLSGREPLHGEFWVYDDNGDWNRSTPKFIIFPDFNGETFRVMIDQHWSQPDNQGELEGFTLRWNKYSLDSYLIMDLFNPGGGPYPRPNGEPGDDRIFSKSGRANWRNPRQPI